MPAPRISDHRATKYLVASGGRAVSIMPGGRFVLDIAPVPDATAVFWLPIERAEPVVYRAKQIIGSDSNVEPRAALHAATTQYRTVAVPHARALAMARLACEQCDDIEAQTQELAALVRGHSKPYRVAVPLHGLMLASVCR